MRRSIAATVLVLFASAVQAAVPTTESIDTLLTITRIERTIDTMLTNIDTLRKQAMNQAFANQALTPEQQKSRDALDEATSRIVRDELSWAKMEPLYVRIYQETFTQDEIDGLIAFYRTPTGVAYIEKLPIVQQKSLVATQALMGPMMQRLQAALKKNQEESAGAASTKGTAPAQ